MSAPEPRLTLGSGPWIAAAGGIAIMTGMVLILLQIGGVQVARDYIFGAVTLLVGLITVIVGLAWRHRLVADASGIDLRGPLGTRHLRWADILEIRTLPPRMSSGRPLLALELVNDGLLVLSPTEIGLKGDDAARRLNAFRARLP